MKKIYKKPEVKSVEVKLGVFGEYGRYKPDHNDNGNHFGWFKKFGGQ